MMRLINFLAGFIVGVVLGGMIALLFAPKPGPETQEWFRRRFEGVLEEARQAAETTRADAHARLAELKAR